MGGETEATTSVQASDSEEERLMRTSHERTERGMPDVNEKVGCRCGVEVGRSETDVKRTMSTSSWHCKRRRPMSHLHLAAPPLGSKQGKHIPVFLSIDYAAVKARLFSSFPSVNHRAETARALSFEKVIPSVCHHPAPSLVMDGQIQV